MAVLLVEEVVVVVDIAVTYGAQLADHIVTAVPEEYSDEVTKISDFVYVSQCL